MFKFNKRRIRKESSKETFEKEGFKIAFGITIILLGVISLFYETSNAILVGVCISVFLFYVVDTFSYRKGFLNFLTISVLLLFCIFPTLPYLKEILKEKYLHTIIFSSIGLCLLCNARSTYKNIRNNKMRVQDNLTEQLSIETHEFEMIKVLVNDLLKMEDVLLKNNLYNRDLNKILDHTKSYLQNEYMISKTKYNLSIKGQNEGKEIFELSEIEKAIQNSLIITREKEEKPVEKKEKKKEIKPKKELGKKS